ncbi:MAG: hypothetical protein IPK71_26610 [Myxococcales bacterium]|nr:hypothetical protein [Myxococcales bacterium]
MTEAESTEWRRACGLRSATVREELTFFALGAVPIAHGSSTETRAASLAHVGIGRGSSARAPFEDDRDALLALSSTGLLNAQWLPVLAAPESARPWLVEAAKRPFDALGEVSGTDAVVHGRMRRADTRLSELLLCDMALAHDTFVTDLLPTVQADAPSLSRLASTLAELEATFPGLGRASVVATALLGPSGRVFRLSQTIVFVGFSQTFPDPDEAALLALHEVAVLAANAPYAEAERAAIDAIGHLVQGTRFEPVFARRIRRLDLRALVPRGTVDEIERAVVEELTRAP